jgi:hypothetical protein
VHVLAFLGLAAFDGGTTVSRSATTDAAEGMGSGQCPTEVGDFRHGYDRAHGLREADGSTEELQPEEQGQEKFSTLDALNKPMLSGEILIFAAAPNGQHKENSLVTVLCNFRNIGAPIALEKFSLTIMGSAQEFGGTCILSRFLKNDKFCFCDRHALRLEQ